MILVISRFCFEGWIWVLIASVPDLCILFTFTNSTNDVSILFKALPTAPLVISLIPMVTMVPNVGRRAKFHDLIWRHKL